MFSIGMGLSVQDFLYLIRKPKAAIIGLTGQIIGRFKTLANVRFYRKSRR